MAGSSGSNPFVTMPAIDVRQLPSWLLGGHMYEEACRLLTNFDYLVSRAELSGVNGLALELDRASTRISPDVPGFRFLECLVPAFRRQMHTFSEEPSSLFQQIHADLCEEEECHEWLSKWGAIASKRGPWVRPVTRTPALKQRRLSLVEHSGQITSISFSQGGDRILTSSADCTCKLWDVQTGACVVTLEGHGEPIFGACLSPDGSLVASVSGDNTCRLWDSRTGACIRAFSGHTDSPWGCVIFPGNTHVLAGTCDGQVTRWDVASGESAGTAECMASRPVPLGCSHDGQEVVFGDRAGVYHVRCSETLAPKRTLTGAHGRARIISYSPGDRYIMVVDEKGKCVVFNRSETRPRFTISTEEGTIIAAQWLPEKSQIATLTSTGTCGFWDLKTGSLVEKMSHFVSVCTDAAFAPDARILATALDNDCIVWDVSTGRKYRPVSSWRLGGFHTVAFSRSGELAVMTDLNGEYRIYNLRKEHPYDPSISSYRTRPPGCAIMSAMFSSDGDRVIGLAEDGAIEAWNSADGSHVETLQEAITTDWMNVGEELREHGLELPEQANDTQKLWWEAVSNARQLRSDERITYASMVGIDVGFVSLHQSEKCRLHSLSPAVANAEIDFVGKAFRVAKGSPDGRCIALAGRAGCELWDPPKRMSLGEAVLDTEFVRDLAWDPSSTTFAAACASGRCCVVSRAKQDVLWSTDIRNASYVGFSPCGRLLGFLSSNGRLTLVNPINGTRHLTCSINGEVRGFGIAPDLRHVLVGVKGIGFVGYRIEGRLTT